jgi:hypothetical protein
MDSIDHGVIPDLALSNSRKDDRRYMGPSSTTLYRRYTKRRYHPNWKLTDFRSELPILWSLHRHEGGDFGVHLRLSDGRHILHVLMYQILRDEMENEPPVQNRIVSMPLSTLEGIGATLLALKEELNSLKSDLHTLNAQVDADFKAIEERINNQSKFQAWLTGAGAVVGVIMVLLIAVGAYHFGQWDEAYAATVKLEETSKVNSAQIDLINNRLRALEEAAPPLLPQSRHR